MRKLARVVVTLSVISAAAIAGTLAATAIGAGGQPEEVAAPDPTMVPGTDTIEARTGDPGGGPGWATRVYAAASGQTCSDFGREVRGRIGLVDGAGRFHVRTPDDAGGNCGDPNAAIGLLLAVDFYPDDPTTPDVEAPRTIVHGVAGSRVVRVSVAWPDGDVPLALTKRRAFIGVYGGAPTSVPVTVVYADGHDETLELPMPT